jgi:hypothetical protein
MPKIKTQSQSLSHNQRPTAALSPRAGRRQIASSVAQQPARRAKQKGREVPAVAAVVAATPTPSRQPRSTSKQAAVVALLRRVEGADLATLMAATGWQSHSVRAVLSGLRKQGHHLQRDAGPDGSVYRITAPADGAAG